MIAKVASNVDKQAVPGNNPEKVRINGKTSWIGTRIKRRILWESTVQVELPAGGLPSVIRFRFCRYPNTEQADYTGHFSYPVHPGMAGKEVWITLAHSIIATSKMPVALYVDHNGTEPIVLDGRQVKANAV